MNPAIFIAIFLPLFVIFTQKKQADDGALLLLKNKERSLKMKELATQFIGKDCIFYAFNGTQIGGIVKSISENGVLIENNGKPEIVNLDLIIRIREYPRNKKGKRASIIAD